MPRYELSDSARAISLAAIGAYLCMLIVAGLTLDPAPSSELERLLGGFHAIVVVAVGWAYVATMQPMRRRFGVATVVVLLVWLLKVRVGAVLGPSPVGWALATAGWETAAFVVGLCGTFWLAERFWQLAPSSGAPRPQAAWQVGLRELIGIVAVIGLLLGLVRYVLQSAAGEWRSLAYLPELEIVLLCVVLGFFPGVLAALTALLIMKPSWVLAGRLLAAILVGGAAEMLALTAFWPPLAGTVLSAEVLAYFLDSLARYLVLITPTAAVMLLLRFAGVRPCDRRSAA